MVACAVARLGLPAGESETLLELLAACLGLGHSSLLARPDFYFYTRTEDQEILRLNIPTLVIVCVCCM